MPEVPVLIVGGGPVGLMASLLLSRLGIRSLLVERHPGTAIHPKARGINARTMEVFRQQGIEAAVRKAGLPPERTGFIVWAKSLAGEEIERRVPWGRSERSTDVSPVRACLCAQDYLEPVLRRCAEAEPPGELGFNTELKGFTQDSAGVTATLRDVVTGAERKVSAQYMIAADGAQSQVRNALGVRMDGKKDVYDSVNILLEADLRPWTADRPAALYFIESDRLRGTFLTINAHDRWGFLVNSLKAQGYAPQDFTPERSTELVRLAAGVPDLPVKILGVAPWVASAHVAEQYRHGCIFLAGDAAHEMPPTGGFGMNTGVQDVHNLCWKLALVLQDKAADSLLQSYHDERQPLARIITEQALANAISMGRLQKTSETTGARPEFLNEQGMIFGASYRSAAVVPDGTPPPAVANPITDYVASARPGGRAPHVWLQRPDGERVSAIDLVGKGFTLVAGARGAEWAEAAKAMQASNGIDVAPILVGNGGLQPADERWRETYGIDEGGAVLVRPDGYVGWRSASGVSDPAAALTKAMDAIQSRAS
ncbi:MAG: FAD-dependent monooxygenase [Rhodospirillales bacterium]|nr:FAD-dependent monooxygenase [Rhodospirillales bacterium]